MRFHGMMLLRDEEDVIGECLDHLLTWVDALYIYDTGSTDATWDIVQDRARRDRRVVPLVRQPTVYNDALRSWIFHRVREKFEPGDWCCKLDADEFYLVPPPRFVAERLGSLESQVYLQWYFFRMTTAEADAYETGAVGTAEDRKRPIGERRRHYKLSSYGEPRMFKYRRSMRWPESISFPYNAGYLSRERIPILHYPHRDPEQMKRRYRLRSAMMKIDPKATGGHWKLADWRKDLVDERGGSQAQATGVGLADTSSVDSGPLLYWKPGTELVEHPFHNHLPPWIPKRLAQRVVHPLLLPLLDARRRRFDPEYQPTFISDEDNRRIGEEAGAA